MTPVSGTHLASGGATGAPAAAINPNGEVTQLFTTLLVAQIKNQNPLEPQDPSEFVAQIAQLSQMEALQALASQSRVNNAMLESLQIIALGAQVGSQVTVATDRIVVDNERIQGRFTLADGSEEVSLVVQSESGQQRRIAFGTRNAGDVTFTIDPRALGLVPGTYSVRVETASGETPTVEIVGRLENVRMSASHGPVLEVAHVGQVAPAAITAFNGRAS
ncbi:MAG: flagellar hook capping FlgD N-terminal domain-containing protein [Gammaproteobacteria bacterium]|nr:flagellar basal body rod modification protein [Gammaproteobacteria bacterium]